MKDSNNNRGLGLCSVLTIIFIVLKLVGVIDWSWWLVLSPSLIEIAIVIILLIVITLLDNKHNRKYKYKRSDRIKW